MAFLNKFKKNQNPELNVPAGIDIQYTSYGQAASSYNSQQINNQSNPVSSSNNGHQPATVKKPKEDLSSTNYWQGNDDAQSSNPSNQDQNKPKKYNFSKKPAQQQPVAQEASVPQVVNTNYNNAQNYQQQQNIQKQPPPQPPAPPKRTKFIVQNELSYLNEGDLDFPELEFQKKVVNDIVALGGIRTKQQEGLLQQFTQDCAKFSPCVVGSLIISKLLSNEQPIVKFRSIYAAESLLKAHGNYLNFFRKNTNLIQQSQSINSSEVKYVSLSNQLLGVLQNPSLEIKEQNEVAIDFSSGANLRGHQQQKPIQQQPVPQPTHVVPVNNQILDLMDDDIPIQNPQSFTQPQQQVPTDKKQGLFKKLTQKQNNTNNNNTGLISTNSDLLDVPEQQPQVFQQANAEVKSKSTGLFDKMKKNQKVQQSNLAPSSAGVNLLDDIQQPTLNSQQQPLQLKQQQQQQQYTNFTPPIYSSSSQPANNNTNNLNLLDLHNEPVYNSNSFSAMPTQQPLYVPQYQPQQQQQQQQYSQPSFQNSYQNSFIPNQGQFPQYQQPYQQQYQYQQGYQANPVYSTVNINFGMNENQNYHPSNFDNMFSRNADFNIKDNSPQKPNAKKQIDESAFDFISM